MPIEAGMLEYLREIRDEVCSRCAARHAEEGECPAFGPPCGMELTLAQMVEAIDPAQAGRLADEEKAALAQRCPCPKEELTELVVEASEAVEERRAQRERWIDSWGDG
ncbi:MAG: hypothetical protein U0797_03515 [Gemmataceae bacterium]